MSDLNQPGLRRRGRLRALSVKQPWALAICHGKDVENRTWETGVRGLVAVHASKAFDNVSDDTLAWIAEETGLTFEEAHQQDHRGAVVAVAEIVGCHKSGTPGVCEPMLCSPWAMPDQWHWQLAHVRPLAEPVPCRGALGLWRLPVDVDAAVRAQLDEAVRHAP